MLLGLAVAAGAESVSVRTFNPQPIRISVNGLPKPYATDSASNSPRVVPIPRRAELEVPQGFKVDVYAAGLNAPRWLALTPGGDVLVTETRANRIRRLRDTNGDGVADESAVFADENNGLNIPFGMAFASDSFFLGNTDAVLRYPFRQDQLRLEGRGRKIADLPGGGYNQHWTRNVRVSPDQSSLYVTVGSRSNVEVERPPRASVLRMNLDGAGAKTFAFGLRNPVGLDFHPVTGAVYVTVNERDGLGDDLVPDYFTQIREGEFYGWPYAYLRPENLDPRRVRGGQSENRELAARTVTPEVLFESHSAALGLAFARGDKFPPKYRNGAFVAFRGSWNRSRGTGYKIVFVPFDSANRPEGYYEDFVRGFLIDPAGPTVWGRPVGVLMLPNGSLLFTEEANDRIYRVSWGS
jgi:glucose/arabinose dehydrogenase